MPVDPKMFKRNLVPVLVSTTKRTLCLQRIESQLRCFGSVPIPNEILLDPAGLLTIPEVRVIPKAQTADSQGRPLRAKPAWDVETEPDRTGKLFISHPQNQSAHQQQQYLLSQLQKALQRNRSASQKYPTIFSSTSCSSCLSKKPYLLAVRVKHFTTA